MILSNVKVYTEPYVDPLESATVVIRNGKIAHISPQADLLSSASLSSRAKSRGERRHGDDVIDGTGLVAVAGFWNSHVHFFKKVWSDAASIPSDELAKELHTFTRYGFTTVFDLSSDWKNTRIIRDRIERGDVPGPRIFSTGPGIVPPNALPSKEAFAAMGIMRTPMPEVRNAGEARRQARRLLDDGVDAIKLFASGAPSRDPSLLSTEAMRSAVEEAHRDGKSVFVHPNTADDIVRALAAGADVIAHTTPRTLWTDEIVTRARLNGAALIPTLTLWQQTAGPAVAQLRAWREADADVLFGTDYGAVDADPSPEYGFMARGGMNARAILASLTTEPAARFGSPFRDGRLAAGRFADITVLYADPIQSPSGFERVALTISGGNVIYRDPTF